MGCKKYTPKLGGKTIEWNDIIECLGVTFKARQHLPQLSNKRNKQARDTIELLQKTTGWKRGYPTIITNRVMLSTIPPAITYRAVVFPVQKETKTVYGLAAKAALKANKTSSTKSVLKFLGWEPLEIVIAKKIESFTKRIKESEYPIIRENAKLILETQKYEKTQWRKYTKEQVKKLEQHTNKAQQHPCLKEEHRYGWLVWVFMESNFNSKKKTNLFQQQRRLSNLQQP